jgi:hypothetical protein
MKNRKETTQNTSIGLNQAEKIAWMIFFGFGITYIVLTLIRSV